MVEQASTSPEPQKPLGWGDYDQWYHGLSRDDRLTGMRSGQWPDGTPQLFVDLTTRITIEEGLLISIFRDRSTPIEEVLARPADYVQRQEEERRLRQRQRLADTRGVPVESVTEQDSAALSHQLLKEQVLDVLASLNERERKVLESRFGLEDGRSRTLVEVGRLIGRSESTVRRIEKTALSKLRHPSRSKRLRDYLDDPSENQQQ